MKERGGIMKYSGAEHEKTDTQGGKPKKTSRKTLVIGLLAVLCLTAVIGVQGVHALTKDPSYCVSCHVMEPVYGTWSHSSHREIVGCNDCHTDQTNYATKTYTKITSGVQHLYHNTFSDVPDSIRMNEKNNEMVQNNCLKCHQDVVRNISMDPSRQCFDCHRYTPHSNYR